MKCAAITLLIACAAQLLPRASAAHACMFAVSSLATTNLTHIEPDLFAAIMKTPSATPIRDVESTRVAAIFDVQEDAEVFCEDVEILLPRASSNASFTVHDAEVVEIPAESRTPTSTDVDHANPEPQSFTCCGFLCLDTCPPASWYTVTVRCRCSRGCSGTYKFVLAQDVSPGACRETNAYNNGQWCTKSIKQRFMAPSSYLPSAGTTHTSPCKKSNLLLFVKMCEY